MIRAPAIALLALCAAALSGCIKGEEVISINDDGTVRVRLQYAMSDDAIAQTSNMLALARELQVLEGRTNDAAQLLSHPFTPAAFDKEALQKEFEANRTRGVVLDKLDFSSRDAWKYMVLDCTAINVEALSKIGLFREQHMQLQHPSTNEYAMSLRFGDAAADSPPAIAADSQDSRDLRSILPGFQFMIRVETPGDLIDANTERKTVRSATWDFDLSRNPNALRALQREPLRVIFAGEKRKPTTPAPVVTP